MNFVVYRSNLIKFINTRPFLPSLLLSRSLLIVSPLHSSGCFIVRLSLSALSVRSTHERNKILLVIKSSNSTVTLGTIEIEVFNV